MVSPQDDIPGANSHIDDEATWSREPVGVGLDEPSMYPHGGQSMWHSVSRMGRMGWVKPIAIGSAAALAVILARRRMQHAH